MDAPTYPPAAVYHAPAVIPQPINTRDTPIADIMAIPAAHAILVAEIPGFERRLIGGLVPQLGNFSLQSLVQFGLFQADQLARVDARFRELNIQQDHLR